MRFPILLTVAAAVIGAGSARAGVIDFNFNGLGPLTPTPLTISSGGVSASFSSPSDPGAFIALNDSGGVTYTDNVLVNPNFVPEELDVTFSQAVTGFNVEFATFGNGPILLTALSGGLGGSVVGTNSAVGTVPSSGGYQYPEGTIGFSGTSFDTVALSDPSDPSFLISDFTITANVTTPVPEPSSLALMAAAVALTGLALARRTRKI